MIAHGLEPRELMAKVQAVIDASANREARGLRQYKRVLSRVLISLWDSLMFGRVPGTREY